MIELRVPNDEEYIRRLPAAIHGIRGGIARGTAASEHARGQAKSLALADLACAAIQRCNAYQGERGTRACLTRIS